MVAEIQNRIHSPSCRVSTESPLFEQVFLSFGKIIRQSLIAQNRPSLIMSLAPSISTGISILSALLITREGL